MSSTVLTSIQEPGRNMLLVKQNGFAQAFVNGVGGAIAAIGTGSLQAPVNPMIVGSNRTYSDCVDEP